MRRRDFLRLGAAFTATGLVGSSLWQEALASAGGNAGPYGSLGAPDANGVRLPAGFQSRIVAYSGQPVGSSGYAWHAWPDGGDVFPTPDGGWIYTSNSEIPLGGGVGALRFDDRANVVDAYSILSGSSTNCAGGATPWGTWLSCEEHPNGRVWECDPTGVQAGVVRPAMGRFQHEAVTVDPVGQRLYLTEDLPDGRLYRFTPGVWGDLTSGLLEVARVDASKTVTWATVPEPFPSPGTNPTRYQVSDSTPFRGGEGIVWQDGHVYFTTKGDDRVWDLDVAAAKLAVLYDRNDPAGGILNGVDNITASVSQDLYVAEDHPGGVLQLVLITPASEVCPFLQLTGSENEASEIAGPAFDPAGERLYFSSQRWGSAPLGVGATFEIRGPFRRFVGKGCA